MVICFYLGWSGSTLIIPKHIIKVGSKSSILTCSFHITLSLPFYTDPASKRELNFLTAILVCCIFVYYLKYWTLVDSLLRRPSNSKLGSSLLRKITSTSTSSLFGFKKILEEECLQFEKYLENLTFFNIQIDIDILVE